MNAIVTGATKGIGRAIAVKLAANGYNLAVCARTEKDIVTLKDELKTFGIDVLAEIVDCSQKDQIVSFCKKAQTHFKEFNVLVNNVGTYQPGNLLDEEDEAFENQQQINVNATYYFSKFFGKIMRKQQFGHIFNICSIASKQIIENAGSYCVTKTAMLSLNHVLRKELAQYNVKVTAILPGSTLTASWAGTTISPDKFIKPEDIANSLYTTLNLSKGVNVDELVLTPLNF